jgi:hypothetical protein
MNSREKNLNKVVTNFITKFLLRQIKPNLIITIFEYIKKEFGSNYKIWV